MVALTGWGRKDDLVLCALVGGISRKTAVTGELESRARSAAGLGPRYAVALFDMNKVFNANQFNPNNLYNWRTNGIIGGVGFSF